MELAPTTYPGLYLIDDNHQPIRVPNLEEWLIGMLQLREDGKEVVAVTHMSGITISTVFIGYEIGQIQGKPLLFETWVFPSSREREYHLTWTEAFANHKRILYEIEREQWNTKQ